MQGGLYLSCSCILTAEKLCFLQWRGMQSVQLPHPMLDENPVNPRKSQNTRKSPPCGACLALSALPFMNTSHSSDLRLFPSHGAKSEGSICCDLVGHSGSPACSCHQVNESRSGLETLFVSTAAVPHHLTRAEETSSCHNRPTKASSILLCGGHV